MSFRCSLKLQDKLTVTKEKMYIVRRDKGLRQYSRSADFNNGKGKNTHKGAQEGWGVGDPEEHGVTKFKKR